MRFLIDMPLSPALAKWLAERGHEATHVSHLSMARSADAAILERARADQAVVVTADLDYPRLMALAQTDSPGIILFRGGDYSEAEARERLARALEVLPAEGLSRSIIVIERSRIRRRRLPIEPKAER